MKFLIILMYCDRPNMVRFALDSIAAQEYHDFEVAFIDDSDRYPIWGPLQDYAHHTGIINPFLHKAKVYAVGDSNEQKIKQGGSRFGRKVNEAIVDSDADIALMLCDDDALMPKTLEVLNRYYEENNALYSYGHVLTYNPYEAKNYNTIRGRYGSSLNNYDKPIDPFCKVDASQVSWRIKEYREAGIEFPWPQTAALDAIVYRQMYDKLGPCPFNEQFVQYKGVFNDQLGSRQDMYRIIDKDEYDTAV